MRPRSPGWNPLAHHAVVIGAGMAGLVTARALSDVFERVTLLDRDALPDEPVPRKGAPQGQHVHVLLRRGLEILSELFPGLEGDMERAGVPVVNLTRDLLYCGPWGPSPRFESDLLLPLPSRIALEWIVRRRVQAIDNVAIRQGVKVTGLLGDVVRSRVRGLIATQGAEGEAADVTIEADLVVDASGRGSKAPAWLAALGFPTPPETSIRSTSAYATRWFRRDPSPPLPWRAVALLPRPPKEIRVGLVNPVERDRFIVTLCGIAPDTPPTDEEGFNEFAKSLRIPDVHEFIQGAEPISPIHAFRQMGNQLRRYELLDPIPGGFVALGDAYCAFNPFYGQGMTVGAMSALALRDAIRARRGAPLFTPDFSRSFQRTLARTVRLPWLAATSQDHRLPGTQGDPPDRMMQLLGPYMDQYLRLITEDPDAYRDFLRVVHMLAPPFTILKPRYVARILRRLTR